MARSKVTTLFAGKPQTHGFGATDLQFKWHDYSTAPSKNNRLAKLGHFWQTHVSAVAAYDVARKRVITSDGTYGSAVRQVVPMEPDNGVLRDHGGRDRVLALRLLVDHENKFDSVKNRASLVMDQCSKQNFGFLSDLFWPKRLGAPGSFLRLNGAGIPVGVPGGLGAVGSAVGGGVSGAAQSALAKQAQAPTNKSLSLGITGGASKGAGGGGGGSVQKVLAALCLNVAKRAGFVTDGKDVAPLEHVLAFAPIFGSTQADDDDGPECGKATRRQLGLRMDVAFISGPAVAPLAFGDAAPTAGDIATGEHWISGLAAIGGPPMAEHPKSKQPILARKPNAGIHVFVRIPKGVPTIGNPVPVPTGFPGQPTSVGTPSNGEAADCATTDFPPAENTGIGGVVPIPPSINKDAGKSIDIVVNLIAPALLFQFPVDVRLDVCVISPGETQPVAVDFSAAVSMTSTLFPVHGGDYNLVITIPRAELLGAGGGKISFAFYRLDTDSNPADLQVVRFGYHYGEPF